MQALVRCMKGRVDGRVRVPGSKSHTIRAVAIASAADGECVVRCPLLSGDTESALIAACALGARIDRGDDSEWRIMGTSGRFVPSPGVVDLGNSGTTLRLFSALASTADVSVRFDGDASLRTRPLSPLIAALEPLGASFNSLDGKCPIEVRGPIRGGVTEVDAVSSQFLSALLLALPLVEGDSTVGVRRLNEKPYVEMTLDWLRSVGAEIAEEDGMARFCIAGGAIYSAFDRLIPGDFSTAAFPLGAVALAGGELVLENLDFEDFQGDKAVFGYFESMGVEVDRGEGMVTVKSDGRLKGGEFDLNATPDALPIMAVAGAVAEGETVLFNCPQARIKETDRIALMTRELRKMGCDVEELPDGMRIRGGELNAAEVSSHGDHRIAMAFAVMGLAVDGETIIHGADAAAVTYPSFFDDIRGIGADMEIFDDTGD